ncbi:Non-specific serine/threonine protein kinase [Bertholletia excelsa]
MESHQFYFLLLVIIKSFQISYSGSLSNVTDELALLTFKNLITNTNSVLDHNWTTDVSFCYWIGVTCNSRRQRVRALSVPNMNLEGTISPSIANLSFLVMLNLGNNSFHGSLPNGLGLLPRLRMIDIHINKLEGDIPQSLFQSQKLQKILLAYNRFNGDLWGEPWNFPELRVLNLTGNNLTGTIFPSMGNISRLERLILDGNSLAGEIPEEMGNLSHIIELDISNNQLTGLVPQSIFNISSLQALYLKNNRLSGHFELKAENLLINLEVLNFDFNNVQGEIHKVIFNISSFSYIGFTDNHLSGPLPASAGLGLPNLKGIFLSANMLNGELPASITNASKLLILELSYNFFTGSIPMNLGDLRQLQILNLAGNQLTNDPENLELGFLNSLVECNLLQFIALRQNPLNGNLPDSVANLSSLIGLMSDSAQIQGHIPRGIGNLTSMLTLVLTRNNLTGSIPPEIGALKQLQRLYLNKNKLQGTIPNELCNLINVGETALSNNELSGPIPDCIGNLSELQIIRFGSNKLMSSIPSGLWEIKSLRKVDFIHNALEGKLPPEIGNLEVVEAIDLSGNTLSGEIPSRVGDLKYLTYLSLSKNLFQGPIPPCLGNLLSLEFLDLSSNVLSGTIPKSLEKLPYLQQINVSLNYLQGEIPSKGAFSNSSAKSFMGNQGLCGLPKFQVLPCVGNTSKRTGGKKLLLELIVPLIAAVLLVSALVFMWIMHQKKKGRGETSSPVNQSKIVMHPMVSCLELELATDNFSRSNLFGVGSFGSVYKGVLSDGNLVAVKVLNLEQEKALKSFDAECEVMRTIRHRNLVKVITTCSREGLRAIVLQYMPNGSLENWLYKEDYHLDYLQRINIMLDVAMALDYLHHGIDEPVVHCDLKPSNVLLDEDMVAHLSDFGISKILAENRLAAQTQTLGTIGYIAPEYGAEGIVSTKGDVYSYGIMLMETFTKRKPTDEVFTANWALRQWVESSCPNAVMEVIDADLLKEEEEIGTKLEDSLLSVIELALECSREMPEQRISMTEVAIRLKKIKEKAHGN